MFSEWTLNTIILFIKLKAGVVYMLYCVRSSGGKEAASVDFFKEGWKTSVDQQLITLMHRVP